MGQLFATIGLPRSGKSTFCKEWVAAQPGRVCVCADDIRLSLGHRFNTHVEPFVKVIKETMIKTLLRKHDVIVDGTHTKKDSVVELLLLDINTKFYYIDEPHWICVRRAQDTGQSDLVPIIYRMHNNLLRSFGFILSQKAIDAEIDTLRFGTKPIEHRITD